MFESTMFSKTGCDCSYGVQCKESGKITTELLFCHHFDLARFCLKVQSFSKLDVSVPMGSNVKSEKKNTKIGNQKKSSLSHYKFFAI